MNSDYWTELWREQPLPPAPSKREIDGLVERARHHCEDWDAEAERADRVIFWNSVVYCFLWLPRIWERDVAWAELLLQLIWFGLVVLTLIVRHKRHHLDREHGQSVVERLRRTRAVLRLQRRVAKLNVPAALLLAGMIWLWVVEIGGAHLLGLALAAAVAGAMSFGTRRQWQRIDERIASVDRALEQLDGRLA